MKSPIPVPAASRPHAAAGHAGDPGRTALPDDVSPPRARWSASAVMAVVAVAGLVASGGLAAVDERPLDVQVTTAVRQANDTLDVWHAELSHGLEVSMRAVADGRDTLAPENARATRQTVAMADTPAPATAPVPSDSGSDDGGGSPAPSPVPADPVQAAPADASPATRSIGAP